MVPFVDLTEQFSSIEREVKEALDRLFATCHFVRGEDVTRFEEEFARYLGAGFVVGVGSGTDALHLALLEAGVGAGDEVIVPANSFIATALAVTYTGARPVFVDIDMDSCNMDAGRLEEMITEKTRAVIPVHLYGQPADMDEILEVAGARGIVVIEDASQAHGARYRGKRVGTLGRSGCFSFYPGKNLGAFGDGGAVATDDPEVAKRVRSLGNYGEREKYRYDTIGYNSRLDSIQSAILGVKLKRLDGWNDRRRRLAALYSELLAGKVATPAVSGDRDHVFHIYAIRVRDRDRLAAGLEEAGVGVNIHYPVPIHLQKCYAHLGHRSGDFPLAERASAEELSLPLWPEMDDETVSFVAGKVTELLG
ncbi:MAG: DegT/DnrJ/EryC1/StrS family aminotransferase [Thermodesulfobacteriota bacterium]